MTNTTVCLTIRTKIINKIDNSRGQVPRSRYIDSLLEYALKQKIGDYKTQKVLVDHNSFAANDQQVSLLRGD
jgi:hypothetical protein